MLSKKDVLLLLTLAVVVGVLGVAGIAVEGWIYSHFIGGCPP